MALFQTINERIPRRGILGALMFLACLFSYVIRTNLSIIIVAMVMTRKGASKGPACNADGAVNYTGIDTTPAELPDYGERFEWNQHVQGQLLAAYFYGTLPSSIPAGLLAEKFGGARVVAFGTLIPAILNLLMPWAAEVHYLLVFALRFSMGFFGSSVYPALHAMIARWVPPSEKGMFVWTMQGGPFGTFVTLSLCGVIIHAYGWKTAYYVTSAMLFVFYLLWVLLAYDTPDVHPTITEKERNYIKEQIGTSVSKQKNKLPVKAIATSVPFLVLLYAHFANMWGIYFISTNGPKYTLEILGFDMKNAGALTGLPYISRLAAGVVFAAAGDYCRRKSLLTLGWIRRIFMIFSHIGPAACLLVVTYAGCDRITAIAFMILALTFNGAACQTNLQNHQDLAPNFAGSLYGTMNTIGSFSGFIIPAIIGALTNENNGVLEWRSMFWLTVIVFVSSTVLFWIFGSTSIQSWNDPSQAPNGVSEWRPMFWISASVFISATLLFWIFGSAEIQPWNNLAAENKSANIISDEEKQINLPVKADVQSSGEEEENERL